MPKPTPLGVSVARKLQGENGIDIDKVDRIAKLERELHELKTGEKLKKRISTADPNRTHDRVLFLSDLHGEENAIYLDPLYNFTEDFKPHRTVFMGDMIDPRAISHWVKNKNDVKAQNEGNFLSDARFCRGFIDRTRGSEENDWIIGNHEFWLELAERQDPYYEGMFNLRVHLDIDDFNFVPFNGYTQVGKLRAIHGWYHNMHHAKKTVEAAERSIIYGHVHDQQVYTKVNMLENEIHQAFCIGCLCKLNPSYNPNKPNKWVNGFAYAYVCRQTGNFNLYMVTIINDSFYVNGKYYH